MNEESPVSKELVEWLEKWGGANEMSAFEAVMWRVEVNPSLRNTIVGLYLLDSTPDWQRLRTAHDWASRAAHRFRQKVVEPAFGIGTPTWIEDPNFDLDYHLRRVRLPEPGTMRQLLDFAQTMAMTPFDRARSPWEATLVEGLEGGRSGYVLKLHHSTTDGMGVVQLLANLLSPKREPLNRQRREIERPPSSPGPTMLAARQLARRVADLPAAALQAANQIAKSAPRLGEARDAVGSVVSYLNSARRVFGSRRAPRSPLLKGRSLSWRFDTYDFPLADLKDGARAAGATINDAYIAAVLGGFRRYHQHFGSDVDELPIAFPISIRTSSDAAGGNQFAGAFFAGPMGEPDPIERMRLIGEFVRQVRVEPSLDAISRLTPLLASLPDPILAAVSGSLTSTQDVQISNVPGLRDPMFMAGAEITHAYPFGPLPGVAAMLTMVSHVGRCCLGINVDPAAVTEPELLTRYLQEGFEEIFALA